jgi:hypothetical protein
MWNNNILEPTVTCLPVKKVSTKSEIRWLGNAQVKDMALLVTDAQNSLVVWPEGIQNSRRLDEVEEGDESVDSVYEALVGQSARKGKSMDHTDLLVSDITQDLSDVEDTFVGRKQMSITT